MEMFYNIIKPGENDPEDDEEDDDDDEDQTGKPKDKNAEGKAQIMEMFKDQQADDQFKLTEKGTKIRNKIKFVSKMLMMQRVLRWGQAIASVDFEGRVTRQW